MSLPIIAKCAAVCLWSRDALHHLKCTLPHTSLLLSPDLSQLITAHPSCEVCLQESRGQQPAADITSAFISTAVSVSTGTLTLHTQLPPLPPVLCLHHIHGPFPWRPSSSPLFLLLTPFFLSILLSTPTPDFPSPFGVPALPKPFRPPPAQALSPLRSIPLPGSSGKLHSGRRGDGG